MTLRIDVVTLFPEIFPGPLGASIAGRSLERGLAVLEAQDLRTWGLGRHRSVDDAPYGGGAGMVLRPEPVAGALAALRRPGSLAILLDPGGEPFSQARAHDLAGREHLILICPRYEGVDERVRSMVDLELSIGDFVLAGGELAAMVVCDAVLRLLPGAIDPASVAEESFAEGLLEYPQYTRPPVFAGQGVPAVLRSGDHGAVARWRRAMALERTARQRPDLLGSGSPSVSGLPSTPPAGLPSAPPAGPPPALPALPAAPAGEAAGPKARAILRRRSSGGTRAATGPQPTPSEHE
ncbi:MAG: tRNA (guanosine(37)-N1)-methyltransferase TrmD [Chloroflexota bacterium]|nr:MAG: tRNA (guanosine(37)-N1)-methyltransferase TrmD [Chloroflexota bacterium]